MCYDSVFITVELTEDEYDILRGMLSEANDSVGVNIGFDLTLDSLKEKFNVTET